jgi:anti-sigma factor RsiW
MSPLRRRRQAVVCQQLVELVTDYLEGDLAPADRAAVEAHLAQCGHCTGYVEQVRRMLELTAALPSPEHMPDELLDSLTPRYRHGR